MRIRTRLNDFDAPAVKHRGVLRHALLRQLVPCSPTNATCLTALRASHSPKRPECAEWHAPQHFFPPYKGGGGQISFYHLRVRGLYPPVSSDGGVRGAGDGAAREVRPGRGARDKPNPGNGKDGAQGANLRPPRRKRHSGRLSFVPGVTKLCLGNHLCRFWVCGCPSKC